MQKMVTYRFYLDGKLLAVREVAYNGLRRIDAEMWAAKKKGRSFTSSGDDQPKKVGYWSPHYNA